MEAEPKNQLLSLSYQYDRAAGAAFAEKKDEEAMRLRTCADKLRVLAEQLIPLPKVTR